MNSAFASATNAFDASLPIGLNLGSGRKRREGCVNVDRAPGVHPDIVWNLDQYPFPLPDSHFHQVYAGDVVEHIVSIPDFMGEVHRLCAPGAFVEITTPHFSCANSFTDPTHLHHLGYFSFDYFTSGNELNFYSSARFEIVTRQIVFQQGFVNRLVARLANANPRTYEQRYAWLFPAWFLNFRLRAVK